MLRLLQLSITCEIVSFSAQPAVRPGVSGIIPRSAGNDMLRSMRPNVFFIIRLEVTF
jgi:hypothetical protein